MKKIAKRAIRTALTTLTMAASLSAVTTTNAFAIDQVPCNANDYLSIVIHTTNGSGPIIRCFANAGFVDYTGGDLWIDRISTGNNRVQWYGDGRWQPDAPINKWTVFTWPNHPGGVRIEKIRIL
jgi:Beta/Gamma crystallin